VRLLAPKVNQSFGYRRDDGLIALATNALNLRFLEEQSCGVARGTQVGIVCVEIV
jgi:hypothetical protein